MKPILRTVIDKNGAEETIFTPSPAMIAFSIAMAKNRGETQARICELAGIAECSPVRWKSAYGTYFTSWLEEALDFEVADEVAILERVGMMQAMQPGNYQYWRDLAKSKGIIKEDVRVQNITINTDFKQILVASGGDLNEARKRLLEQSRGLVVENVLEKNNEKEELQSVFKTTTKDKI